MPRPNQRRKKQNAKIAKKENQLSQELQQVSRQLRKTTRQQDLGVYKGNVPYRRGGVGNTGYNLNMTPEMQEWFNTVTNPFGSKGARVPDQFEGKTMILRDGLAMTQVTLNADTAAIDSTDSCAFFLIPGYVTDNGAYNVSQNINSTSDVRYYHVGAMMLDSGGYCVSSTSGNQYYNAYAPQNEPLIFNFATPDDSLAELARIVGAAFRIWPQTEVTTETDTLAVKCYNGMKFSLESLVKDYISGNESFITAISDSNGGKTYENNKGVTVRLDPVQSRQLIYNPKSQTSWFQSMNALDGIETAVVVVQFNQEITGVDNGDGSSYFELPIFFEMVYWLEAVLKQPTPLIALKSPIDRGFNEACNILATSGEICPVIAEGHSFKKFSTKIGQFARHASNFMNNATRFGARTGRVFQTIANEFDN